jgi:PAS domain-containing protein
VRSPISRDDAQIAARPIALPTEADWVRGPFVELLETLPDGVIVLTLDGRIVAVNAQACGLSGYLPDQLIDSTGVIYARVTSART